MRLPVKESLPKKRKRQTNDSWKLQSTTEQWQQAQVSVKHEDPFRSLLLEFTEDSEVHQPVCLTTSFYFIR